MIERERAIQVNFSNIRRGTHKRLKHTLHVFRPRTADQQIAFIFGCQRSGTTLLSRIFERDWAARTFPEISPLSSDDSKHGIRLNAPAKLASQLAPLKAGLIVLKPIVESHRAIELLEKFPRSKAIWIYRNYKDVAASNVMKFGDATPHADLLPIANAVKDNWRAEYVPDDVRALVIERTSQDMSPFEAAVLFWYVRNRIYFDLNLGNHPDIMLCRYESLAESPGVVMPAIYNFLERQYPGDRIARQAHAKSVSKGRDIELSQTMERLASRLLQKLDNDWLTSAAMNAGVANRR